MIWPGNAELVTGNSVSGRLESPREFSRTAKKSPALRVLVIDDEPLIRWALREALVDRGHEVVEGKDTRAVLASLNNAHEDFDVAVIDYQLPDSADLELLASLRKRCPRTQVILMTAFGTPEVIRGALDLGAFRVLGKPFDILVAAELVELAAMAPRVPRS